MGDRNDFADLLNQVSRLRSRSDFTSDCAMAQRMKLAAFAVTCHGKKHSIAAIHDTARRFCVGW